MTYRITQYLLVATAALLLHAASAQALPGFDGAVVTRYPSATNLESCGTCHNNFDPGNSSFNPYGAAVNGALSGFDIDQAMADVESLDSDGDGTSNLAEIDTDAGFFPGWTCDTYGSAVNAPSNLADLVDPIDPGCNGVTTTTVTSTTVTSTSTSTNTSTTTLLGDHACSQPVTTGPEPVATDCLYILNAAVDLQICTPACICDVNGSGGNPNATDALICLNVAVGIPVPLDCPCGGGTSTTVTSSTVTSTTVTSTSSTTEDSTTTTTTLP